MSNGISKPGIRQQQRSISERIQGLEQNFTRFLIGANQRIQNHDQRLDALEEQIGALVELSGTTEVEAVINRTRVERARAAAAAEKLRLEEGVADGYVLTADKVEERSLVVGRYLDAKGEVIEPGRAQIAVPTIKPEFKSEILGHAVGAIVDLKNGTKFELTEIFNVDEAKAKAVFEAKQAAATEAAAAVAQAEGGGEEAPSEEAAQVIPAESAEAPAQEAAQE